jgi:hypothetical protein
LSCFSLLFSLYSEVPKICKSVETSSSILVPKTTMLRILESKRYLTENVDLVNIDRPIACIWIRLIFTKIQGKLFVTAAI